jgi:tellurite resistance protein TehA-like permease
MSSSQGMDIRAPIGGLFTLLGLMLVGYGLVAPDSTGAATLSAGINVNLWWGLALLAFGVFMLLLARRAMKHPVPPHAHPHPEE